jgi:hypothetical protein
MGGECDFGRGVWDQGEPGRVGDVSGVWEVAVAGEAMKERNNEVTKQSSDGWERLESE